MDTERRRDGVLIVDKPAGCSSFDVIRELRRAVGARKAGHTGTLDPAATGVLVVCFGWATRIIPWLDTADKRYLAEVRLGIVTNTDDAEGEVVATHAVPQLTPYELESALSAFVGALSQVPPQFSAIHVNGERAYKSARKGEKVELAARSVHVHSIDVDSFTGDRFTADIHVSKGTYIRALARDVGASLGCGAHLSSLRRTAAGPMTIDMALPLEELCERLRSGDRDVWTEPWDALEQLPELVLDAEEARRLALGQRVPIDEGRAVVGLEVKARAGVGELGICRIIRSEFDGCSVIQPVRLWPGDRA